MSVTPEKEALLKEEDGKIVENKATGGGIFNTIKGISCALGVAICFSFSATCVQLLERRIPDLELNTFRNAIPLVLYVIVFLLMRRWPVIERGKIGITFLYTVVSFMNGTFLFIAVSLLPAAAAMTTCSATFLIFSLFTFSLCWDENITLKNCVFAVLCASGVVLVIQPWMSQIEYTRNGNSTTAALNNLSTTTDHVMDLSAETGTTNITLFTDEMVAKTFSGGVIFSNHWIHIRCFSRSGIVSRRLIGKTQSLLQR